MATIPTGSNVIGKDQAFGYGFGGGIGLEYLPKTSRPGTRRLLYSEFGFRDGRTTLVQTSNFEVSGMIFSVGFGF